MKIHSYPKIYNLGHFMIADLFKDPVIVEEKVDGSQFSFGIIGGELMVRSKGKQMDLDAPEKMFTKGVETVRALEPKLEPDWTYRCEYLQKPKHNTLAYDRAPKQHLVLYDVDQGLEKYTKYSEKVLIARVLGLDCVPLLMNGIIESFDAFKELLDTQSVLGGQKIEGLVIKNYHRCGADGKCLMGKHVSEEFKETHATDWKKRQPSGTDIIAEMGEEYRTPARWRKSVQHLRERGELENTPRDIGKLLKEINLDVQAECKEEIKERLFKWAWKQISRSVIRGFPEWYKEELAKSQFGA